MPDCGTMAAELESYIRPETFPLAIRLFRPGEPLPERCRRPAKDLGMPIAVCQGIGMARRYGWTLAMGAEDLCCPIALVAFGHREPVPFYTEGHLACGMYNASLEAGARSEAAVPKLSPDKAGVLVVGPLAGADYEPQTVLVYGNPAQIMRLLAGVLWHRGGSMTAKLSPRADCADIVIGSAGSGEPQFVLPCYGDRVFGQTQDHEVAFTIPFSRLPEVLEGLRGTQKGGVRYPIPAFLRYRPAFPATYNKLAELWQAPEV